MVYVSGVLDSSVVSRVTIPVVVRDISAPVDQPQSATGNITNKREIDPLLGQCWASVVDGGQTLTQRWVIGLWNTSNSQR